MWIFVTSDSVLLNKWWRPSCPSSYSSSSTCTGSWFPHVLLTQSHPDYNIFTESQRSQSGLDSSAAYRATNHSSRCWKTTILKAEPDCFLYLNPLCIEVCRSIPMAVMWNKHRSHGEVPRQKAKLLKQILTNVIYCYWQSYNYSSLSSLPGEEYIVFFPLISLPLLSRQKHFVPSFFKGCLVCLCE